MRAPGVVELDPIGDDSHRMLLGLEAMPMHTLLFQCPDHTFDPAVLLRAVRRDEPLAQAVAVHQRGIIATAEHQAVVRTQ